MSPRTDTILVIVAALCAAPLANAQFYGDPPDENHPWAVHDMNRPQPPRVEPGVTPGAPPSDAIVLLDSSEASMANWEHVKKKRKGDWLIKDGVLQCTPGAGFIRSKEQFGDCQLHVEWAAPTEVKGDGQQRGNSGIFLMGITEVQVLDNFDNPTYPDGSAGSMYGVMPPMANPLNKPGEWQTYDIVFRRPIVVDGKVLDDGYFTVHINGVLVQDHTPIEGGGGHKKRSKAKDYPEKGPLTIQDHGNPVRFRNIWYRNLRKRPIDGGTDGRLTKEATTSKRAEIAAMIRKDASTKSGKDKMLRLLESLSYESDEKAAGQVTAMGKEFVESVKATPANKMESRKGEVMQVNDALQFMVKHQRIEGDDAIVQALGAIVREQGWDKKK